MSDNNREQFAEFKAEENAFSNISRVIGVVSGKGGVGKSFVTASLANAFAVQGLSVGILDADITGPSIPRMYGIHEKAEGDGNGLYPAVAANGVEIMSMNLILEGEEEPVVWRGPVVGGVVKQFWSDVIWGQLDLLFVDMPPGTGDVPLTVYQSLPVEGVIVVTSPQDLVKMIVTKAVKMAQMMDIPVLGLVENFSYMECPDCGKKLYPFGESKLDAVAEELQLPILGRVPLQPELAKLADSGDFAGVVNEGLDEAVLAIRRH